VSFTSSDPGKVIGAPVDHGDGTYTATITASRTAGAATITATDNSSTPPQSATATLTETNPPVVKVTLKPTSIVANGRATSVATATVTLGGRAVNGANVSFASSDPGETIGTVTALGSGHYSAVITASHTVGSPTITATANGGTGSATLKQVSTTVRVTVKPTAILANGTSTAVVTATVTAGFAAVNGEAVTFQSSDPGETIGPVTNSGSGHYTATITSSTTVGTATITATDTSVSPSPSGHAALKQT
jgi:adhesin/invasin